MMALISANWILFLVALLIGIVTAFWVWAASGRESHLSDEFDGDDGLLEKAGEAVEPEVAIPEPTPVPVAPVAVPESKPTPAPAAVEPAALPVGNPKIAAAVGSPDNLRLIKGVGPKLNGLLNKLGVTRFDQIAAWQAGEIAEVDQYLEAFSGRITRDSWIDQAKFLAKDDIAGFEAKYGKL